MDERRRASDPVDQARGERSSEVASDVVDRLFVYGSLREGQSARSLIASRIRRCERATAAGAIYVLPTGYSALVESDAPSRVTGEVIWLTDLRQALELLDEYEGADYARVIRTVQLATGELISSWIYVLAEPDGIERGTRVEHGDWVRFCQERGQDS
jgi:gamma-glutamylcyclotransferase (GGCT)/AIG2-like uncharacterized protein YtfP